jgi:RHS repeat-associated protein
MTGNLGYQSAYTEFNTGRVNMAARWYNSASGQFDNRDSVANSPTPTSVNANQYAYANDNPLTNADPSGHDSCATGGQGCVWNSTCNCFLPPGGGDIKNPPTPEGPYTHTPTSKPQPTKQTSSGTGLNDASNGPSLPCTSDTTCGLLLGTCSGTCALAAAMPTYTLVSPHFAFGPSVNTELLADKYAEAKARLGFVNVTPQAELWIWDEVCEDNPGLCGEQFEHLLRIMVVSNSDTADDLYGYSPSVALVNGCAMSQDGCGDHAQAVILTSDGSGPVTRGGPTADPPPNLAVRSGDTFVMFGGITGGSGNVPPNVRQVAVLQVEDPTSGAYGNGAVNPSCHSFDPSTRVLLADGTTRPIRAIEVGDRVVATNPQTGKTSDKNVTALHVNHDSDLTDLTLSPTPVDALKTTLTKTSGVLAHPDVLHTTTHHLFWDATTRRWTAAGALVPGHRLTGPEGQVEYVAAVVNLDGTQEMRDITVADDHSYYVMAGDNPILVHNCEIGTQVDYFDSTDDLLNAVHNERLRAGDKGGNWGAARLEDGSIITAKSGPGKYRHTEVNLLDAAGGLKVVDLYSERAPCAGIRGCQRKLGGVNVTWSLPWNGSDKDETDAIRANSRSRLSAAIGVLFSFEK